MTALVLFPARIKFTNPDGTLTPEAYRALQEIVNRTGGVLGNVGSDTYGDIQAGATGEASSYLEMVLQSGTPDAPTGGGSTVTGTATIDFGSAATDTSVFVVDAAVGASSYVSPFIKPSITATNTEDDHIFEHLEVVAGIPVAGGFTLYGKVAEGLAHGAFTVGYTVN